MDDQNLFGRFEEFPSTPNIHTSHQFSLPTTEGHENALSSEEIIKAAGAQYMHAWAEEGFNLNYSLAVPGLPGEEQNGIELAHLVLASAEMVSNQRYEEASRLLGQCKIFSSHLGNPIERLCYYFSEALQERMERQTCSEPYKGKEITPDVADKYRSDYGKSEFASLAALCTSVLPYCRILQFTAVEAILDAVRHERRIHVIDLGIRTGCQWTALIQSLSLKHSSSSSVKHLKITAVGVNSDDLEDSGRRLTVFARAMGISFSFCSVKISKFEEINEDLFNVQAGEFVAVNAPTVFKTLLYDPTLLGNTVNVIRKLNPRVLLSSEVEGQHNSPFFADRFVEALFYYSAYFDCLEAMLPDRNDLKRVKFEEVCCGSQIRSMIACEGEDRRVRHVKMDIWRSFFTWAGFREKKFSYQAWCQARLLLKQYVNAESFTIESNGSAMSVGWKGRPLHTLSIWACKK
ncbi:GRAS family protein RAM1-like [Cryptomeria japonica]|nr:GRAS family protein RAM1-like [Cryptomeria japonica]